MKIHPEEHLGLAYNLASRFVSSDECVRDTIEFSLACEALIVVSQNYVLEQGSFSSVAYTAIMNKLIDYKRTTNRKKRKVKFEYINENQWESQIDQYQWEDQLEDISDFIGWLNKISWSDEEKNDLEILMSVKMKSEPITELADKYGLSRPTIYQKIQRITSKIRERYRDFL